MLKKLKWSSIGTSIAYIAAGIALIINPAVVSAALVTVFGVILIAIGALNILGYFLDDVSHAFYSNRFAEGCIRMLIGIVMIAHQDMMIALIPLMLGLVIMISGIYKLQEVVNAARMGQKKTAVETVMSLLSIVFGILVLANLKSSGYLLFQLGGAALIYCGVTDQITLQRLSKRVKKYEETVGSPQDANQRTVVDAEVIQEDGPDLQSQTQEAQKQKTAA